jgi:hypothetical protein
MTISITATNENAVGYPSPALFGLSKMLIFSCKPCCGIMHVTSIFFVQCAEEFKARRSNRKSSAEESRLIGVDEIISMKQCACRLFEAIGKPVLSICAHVHAQKLT